MDANLLSHTPINMRWCTCTHTSSIYVEKLVRYNMVNTALAKRLCTGDIEKNSFVKFPILSPNTGNLGNPLVKSVNYPRDPNLDQQYVAES